MRAGRIICQKNAKFLALTLKIMQQTHTPLVLPDSRVPGTRETVYDVAIIKARGQVNRALNIQYRLEQN